MSQKKDKKEDKSLQNVFIVLAILIGFYWGGYFIGTHLTPEEIKDKQYVSSPSDKEIEYSGEEEKIVHLMNHLNSGMDCWNIEEYAKDEKVTSNDLSNERILQVVEASSLLPNNIDSITLEDFLNEANKYFLEYTFDPEKIDYQGKECFAYSYDAESKTFKKHETACGGTCGPNSSRYKITSAVEKDNVLRVYVRVLFGSQAENTKFYSDYGRVNFVTDDVEKLNEYYEDGGHYLFTFYKQDGYYVFASSELV